MERNARSEADILPKRLSELIEAICTANQTGGIEAALREILFGARSLTGARYGLLLLRDAGGQVLNRLSSGLAPDQEYQFWHAPEIVSLHEQLYGCCGPVPAFDMPERFQIPSRPTNGPSLPLDAAPYLVMAPICSDGNQLGHMCLLGKEGATQIEFTVDDEAALVMFASQAALVIDADRGRSDEQRARHELDALVETTPVGVMMLDGKAHTLKSANGPAQRLFGQHSPPGMPTRELLAIASVHNSGRTGSLVDRSTLHERLMAANVVRGLEIVVDTPSGRRFATVNSTPVDFKHSRAGSIVATFQDVTACRQLDWLRNGFLNSIVNELREPLASIKGSAATLLAAHSSMGASEASQYHQSINEQVDHLREVISDFVDSAGIESGTLELDLQAIEMLELLEDARRDFMEHSGWKTVRISASTDLPTAMADKRRISKVVSKLLRIVAYRFHDATPLSIEATIERSHVAVSFTCRESLESEGQVPHLFMPRIGSTSQAGQDLHKLGLAVCKGIVEAHGGRIWTDKSVSGLDSRYTLTVPLCEPSFPPTTGRYGSIQSDALRAGYQHQLRVVSVDDDVRTLESVRAALTGIGCDLIVTSEPGEAAIIINEFEPHVVLIDGVLAEAGNQNFVQSLASTDQFSVIVMISADDDQLVTRAFELGAMDYIVKPFASTELVSRVRSTQQQRAANATSYVLADLEIACASRSVTVAGQPVDLTPTEYRLLVELADNAGIALTHGQLFRRVWGIGRSGDARPMRTAMKNLRRKLGDDASKPKYIITVPHVGYRMLKLDGT